MEAGECFGFYSKGVCLVNRTVGMYGKVPVQTRHKAHDEGCFSKSDKCSFNQHWPQRGPPELSLHLEMLMLLEVPSLQWGHWQWERPPGSSPSLCELLSLPHNLPPGEREKTNRCAQVSEQL